MPTLLATATPGLGPQTDDSAPDGVMTAAPGSNPPEARRLDRQRLTSLFLNESDFYGALGPAAEQVKARIAEQPDPLRMRQRVANTAFLADRLNLPAAEIAARYDTLRTSYARQMFPDEAAGADEGVFFAAVGKQLVKESQEAELMGEMNRRLFTAAVEGKDFKTAWEGMNIAGAGRTDPKRADLFNAWALQRWEANSAQTAKLAPIVGTVAESLAPVRDAGVDSATSRWDAAVEALLTLDDGERSTVLALAAERAKAGVSEQQADGFAKGMGALVVETVDLVSQGLAGLANAGQGLRFIAPGLAGGESKRSEIERTLWQISTGEVDPIKADSFAGQVALDFTRSVPTMLAALTGPGLALDYFAMKQNAREALEGQGVRPFEAEATATVQAIPQAALFFATSKMVFLGKTPGFAMPTQWTAKNLAASVGKLAAFEVGGNYALNEVGYFTDAGIQQVAAQLTDAVPDVDWREFGRAFVDRQPQSLAMAIPGALIGTGVASFKNAKAGLAYLKRADVMDDLGFTPEAQQAVLEAPDYVAAEQAFREGWETRDTDVLTDEEAARQQDRERERLLSSPDSDGTPFEALLEPHPDDVIVNPDAPDVPAAGEERSIKTRSELAYVEKEIVANEAEMGRLPTKRNRRHKEYEKKIRGWLRRDYLRRLELQADLDVPGARDALTEYHNQVEQAAVPTRARLVWDYVSQRKLPPLSALASTSLRGEIADLEIPRRFFDSSKTHGLDVMGQSMVEWLAENGDADAAAMLGRGEQFSETEVAALIGDAYQDFRAREERAARGLDEVPVPRIEMPKDVTAALPEAKKAPERVDVEPLGRRYLVAEGIGEPVAQFQVRRPGDERGVTMTAEQMQAEGLAVPPDTLTEIASVRALDGEGFRAWSKQQKGGFTTTAHNLGRSVKSRGEVNALLRAQIEAETQLDDATAKARKGDMDAMNEAMLLSTKGQFFREAYEAALGVLSAGDHLRARDPNYVPPIVRTPDGAYRVQAVDGAPPVQAATAEGAALVEQAQRAEVQESAAAQPPEPRPEDDSGTLPERVTALNKDAIAAMRSLFPDMDQLAPPVRERFIQVLDEAKRTGAATSAELVAIDVLAKRRMTTAAEHAAMVLHAAELQNQYETATAAMANAYAKGDTSQAEAYKATAEGLQTSLDRLTEAADVAGTEIARALSIRRMRLNRDDYTLARVTQRARSAKQGNLTPEQAADFQRLDAELTEQRRIIAEQKARLAAQDLEIERTKAETFVAEGRARRRQASSRALELERRDIKRQLLEMGVRVNDVTSLVPMSFEYARLIAKMADTYITEGVGSLSELTNKLKADLPDLSDQDIFVAVGRQTKKEAVKIENEAKRRVRELRSQAALWAKINALLEGKRPDGMPAGSKEQQNQLLRQTLSELRAQANRTIFEDAALRRVDAQIAEIQNHLAQGTRPGAKPEGLPESDRLTEAKRTLDELRQEMGAIDTIAELERELGEATPKAAAEGQPAEVVPPSEQRARLNSLRERIAELRDQIDAQQVDPAAVNADRLAKLQRLALTLEEQIETGARPAKPAKGGVPDTADVTAARKAVRELERLMRTNDSIAALEDQLRRHAAGEAGALKVSAPEQRILANAALEKALIRQKQLRRQIDEAIERMRKKSAVEQVVETLLVPRTLLAMGDMSATLRQGLLLSASRPVTAARAFVSSFRAFLNENTADAIAVAIESRPKFADGEAAGLFLSEIDGRVTAREENFLGGLIDRIPGLSWLKRGSERSMATTLNLLRVAAFDSFIEAHPEATPAQRKAYAHYVNAASGRGNVKWNPEVVKTLNAVFFAPRYAVSRFQALYSPFKNFNDPVVRNAIVKDFAALVGTGLSVLGLAAMAGAETSLDPSESDFGKIIIGDTRIDIWGGLQQPARLVAMAALVVPQRAELVELEKEIEPLDAALRFVSYKLSPAITVPLALATQENMIGQEQGWGETALRSIAPLTAQEAWDVAQENESAAAGVGATVAGFLGLGVQQHEK